MKIFSSLFSKLKPRLMVAETNTSTWNYHLRLVTPGEEKLGGGAGPALCGSPLGWDTKIPLFAYGQPSDITIQHWCEECSKVAQDQYGADWKRSFV